jgi:M6 family metalloprotease-like protein
MLAFPAALVAQVQTFDGTLLVVWGDPNPAIGTGGETRYMLVLPDGRTARLQLAGQEQLAESFFSMPVTVTGELLPGPAAADPLDAGTIAVTSIAAGVGAAVQPAIAGTRRVIYLLARFPDDVDVPHPPAFFDELNNPDTPPPGSLTPATMNGFFKKTSYNQFSWIGDVGGVGGLGAPGGWLTLPQPRSFYVPCVSGGTCANLSALATDAMAAGRAQGINFSVYDNINFVFSNDLDCCAWGGGIFGQVEMKSFGATWEPPWGQNASTYAHEMGHSIGLPHSGWVYYAYDSPWDIMSSVRGASSNVCGSYLSANNGRKPTSLFCSEPGNAYIAAHLEFLAWLPPSNMVVTDTFSSLTTTVEALTLPLGATVKMIKICLPGYACSGSLARYLTVEARVRGLGTTSQFDNGLFAEGVIVHEFRRDRPRISGPCYFNNQSGWALPIDATPGDYDSATCTPGGVFPYALFNAQLGPGQNVALIAYGIRISVESRTGATYVVSVLPLAVPVITTQPASVVISSGQTATLTVAATSDTPLAYQWYIGERGVTTRPIAGATANAYTTPPQTSSTRYWVRVSNSNGSADSTMARVIVAFTDDEIVAGVTAVRSIHLTELRARVDALRVRFGLAPYAWNDAIIAPGLSLIRALHISDLREALRQAYIAAGIPAPFYTDPLLTAGGVVRAVHIRQLRTAVQTLEET